MGLASLMRPEGPLPDVPFAGEPLRRGPNDAAAILAAKLARWRHVLSSWFGALARVPESTRSVCLFARAVNPYRVAALRVLPCANVVTREFRFRRKPFFNQLRCGRASYFSARERM
jgi:hypothetical protein